MSARTSLKSDDDDENILRHQSFGSKCVLQQVLLFGEIAILVVSYFPIPSGGATAGRNYKYEQNLLEKTELPGSYLEDS